jgi:hypothetical protein
MKDAKGHGSNGRGVHSMGVNAIGNITLHPDAIRTLTKGDGSVKPTTGKSPSAGYMVSIPGHTQVVSAAALSGPQARSVIEQYANAHSQALSEPNAHIGRWQEPGTDKVYLDVSHNIKDRSQAVGLGKAHNQIAIWDLKNNREINTGGTGK